MLKAFTYLTFFGVAWMVIGPAIFLVAGACFGLGVLIGIAKLAGA